MAASRWTNTTLWLSFALILSWAVALIWAMNAQREMHFLDRGKRIAFLIDELTTTPERQQRALDEIVLDEDGAFVYLVEHLNDQRALASMDAMFLNTHASAFEKHFHSGGSRVGEVVLRYLCWKTAACAVDFDPNDAQSVRYQRQKIEKYCRDRFLDLRFRD